MIDFSLSEEQEQIVEGAADLLQQLSPVSRLRASRNAGDIQHELAGFGWFGVALPEERGGLGLGIIEETLLYREAGRALLSPTILATTIAARLGDAAASSDLLRGVSRAALGLADGGEVVVLDRGEAEHILLVRAGGDVALASAAGFRGHPIESFDETLSIEKGVLDIQPEFDPAQSGRLRLLTCAMLAGMAQASCDLAVSYAKVREQFGQPIGAFQAIKHMCADMALRTTAAEAQVKMAAVFADAHTPGGDRQLDAAALIALKAARENAADAIQVHGGIGFTAECDAHFFLKRAYVLSALLGGLDGCRNRVLTAAGTPA